MNPLLQLAKFGQSYWMDHLCRPMLESGDLVRRVREEDLRGLASSPQILSDAIAGSDAYDPEIGALVEKGTPVGAIYEALAVTEVPADSRLAPRIPPNGDAGPVHLMGRVAVANAKQAYQRYKEIFSGEEWETLTSEGARPQRLLWAGTGVKNPVYGPVASTLESDTETAEALLNELSAWGIDLRAVTDQLLEEGVSKFVAPFDHLMTVLAGKVAAFEAAARSQDMTDSAATGSPTVGSASASQVTPAGLDLESTELDAVPAALDQRRRLRSGLPPAPGPGPGSTRTQGWCGTWYRTTSSNSSA